MTEKKYDVVIIGSGPAGMTAAMYTARSEMKTLLLDRGVPGGQMNNTAEIENYPGYETIMGPELSMKMAEPLEGLGVENAYGFVTGIEGGPPPPSARGQTRRCPGGTPPRCPRRRRPPRGRRPWPPAGTPPHRQ